MTPFLQRQLSWNRRITRTDFIPYPIAFLVLCFALGLWQDTLSPGSLHDFAMLLIWPLLAFLIFGASKRCRDADANPWLGILAVLVPFGVLILLFTPGTSGTNRYGPDPRQRNTEAEPARPSNAG